MRAFIMWGGGSLGAAQVGMLRALTARGVRADIVVGASVGALNAAYYAARPDADGVEELAHLWLSVGSHDVYPLDRSQALRTLRTNLPLHPVRGVFQAIGLMNYTFPFNPALFVDAMLGRRNHLFDNQALRRFLQRILPIERLQEGQIPLSVLTTDVHTGQAVVLSRGPALPALLASTAIPGIYPSVRVDGHVLMDGEFADQTTLDHAVRAGADEIYLLAPGYPCRLPDTPSSSIAMALHGYNLLAKTRIDTAISKHDRHAKLRVLPPINPIEVLPIDFGQSADLIDRATESTLHWLTDNGHPPTEASTVSEAQPQVLRSMS
jgi:NTE family protein